MSQKGISGNSPRNKPTFPKYGEKHRGGCVLGTGNCFGYGKENHKVRDCANGSGHAQVSDPSYDAPK